MVDEEVIDTRLHGMAAYQNKLHSPLSSPGTSCIQPKTEGHLCVPPAPPPPIPAAPLFCCALFRTLTRKMEGDTRRYVRLPEDCVSLCAENLGIQASREVISSLVEDVSFRIRQTTKVSQ